MICVNLNIIESAALAVVALYVGSLLKKRMHFLERFCIPAPVIGGLIFALITLAGNLTQTFSFNFDQTLQNLFMTAFFTSVGYSASLKSIRSGSRALLWLMIVVAIIVVAQDIIALSLSGVVDMPPLMALCTGSISMVGGLGTATAFGEIIEEAGVEGAKNVALVATTFGLAIGGIIGSPVGKMLIDRNKLVEKKSRENDTEIIEEKNEKTEKITTDELTFGTFQIILSMGIGSALSALLESTGLLFPSYVGALVVAVIIRNLADFSGKFSVHTSAINSIGHVSLLIFITMALMALRLWELANLAMPMLFMLFIQSVFMILFVYFVAFRLLGKDYDSAIVCAGVCGFGMGATPNAMANMEALVKHYALFSPKAFLIVPIVGGMFIDLFNSLVILICINIF